MSTTLPPTPSVRLSRPAPGSAWSTSLPALALVVAAVLALYWSTAAGMVGIWIRSETFMHAFLVPPICAWLLWRDRERLAAIPPRANAWMLLPMAGIAVLWLLGELAAVNAITQLAFVAMLALAVPAVLGMRVARAAAFPLAFLFFAVPLGEFLLPLLMQMTADFTVAAVRLSGVPVFREGLMFVIPSGQWSVVEACSGVRYLIASFMVGTLYAYLMYSSTRRRVIFMGVSLLMPLLANWVRAYLIVMLGHLSDNRIATGVDHLIYGWLFFGIVIFLLFWVGIRWSEPPAPRAAAATSGQAVAGAGTRARMQATFAVAAALIVLAAVPPWTLRELGRRESTAAPVLAAPATLAPGWSAVSGDPGVEWKPKLDNPSALVDAVYRKEGLPPVGLYVAYYRQQDDLRKLSDADALLAQSEDKRWRRVVDGRRHVATGSTAIDLRSAELRPRDELSGGGETSVTAWQVYWVGGRFTSSDAVAKAGVAIDRLLGRGDDSAELIVYVGGTSPALAERALQSFVQDNFGVLDAQLTRTWRQR
ncbi:exosortase A [Scleromatobacter humisilvae]|uniref:Exosortase A n=1 Tax=Scleromatobacter humisilvae TaxID=2897159 RepID=A0A9X1YIJ5_9BURK|nr:exosortase A [Scleromatobacter humisilvae]MCK9686367.1 exosortase A [Scleromatobacter humisilvae]